MQDDIHSSCRLAAALIAGLIAIVGNTAMLEASRCRHGCFQDGFHILVGLLMAVFYAFVLEPVLAGSALVKGLVYALLVWLANAFITLPWIGKSPTLFRCGRIHVLWIFDDQRARAAVRQPQELL